MNATTGEEQTETGKPPLAPAAWYTPEPYYQADGITLYCADNRHVMPLLDSHDLLLTDPPYGIGADEQMSKQAGQQYGKALARKRDYGESSWDRSVPPEWIISQARELTRNQIVWGGNYYGLPSSSCWLVWDKENGDNNFADCELAWTNLPKAVRRVVHQWNGMLRKGKEDRHHPTQKPLDVIQWCIGQVDDCDTILDPWAGSGTTLVAAKNLGKKATGIEINERYCEIAVARLAQGVLSL